MASDDRCGGCGVDTVQGAAHERGCSEHHAAVGKFERIIPGSGAVAFDPLGADAGWLNEHDRQKVEALKLGERAYAGAVGFIRRIA